MSEQTARVVPLPTLAPGQVVLQGKVREVVKLEKKGFRFLIVQPAADEYSFPRSYPVYSETRPGAQDEVVTLRCEVTTFGKRITSKETGEQMTIHNVGLRVIA